MQMHQARLMWNQHGNSGVQTIELEVGGMHCSACSSAVEKALTAVPGVQSASVSLVMRRATVVADTAVISPVRC